MRCRLLVVPYEVGAEAEGMGAGPLALEAPLAERLRPDAVRRLRLRVPPRPEAAACFDLNRQLAEAVAEADAQGVLPVVLTGNCHSQQAVVAGLGSDGLGLAWFDCHADFHTPETTESGFFDGFALSMTVGDCWSGLCATVPGFRPLPQERVVLCGARDVDAGERARLDGSRVREVAAADLGEIVGARRVSLHVDLDALDPSVARANRHATPGGLALEELTGAVRALRAAHPVAALTLSAYDPSVDPDGAVIEAALAVAEAVA